MKRLFASALAAAALVASPAAATTITYSVSMDGAQEVPGPGDADGTAIGTITINDATGDVSWSFTYANIAAPSAMHIHGPAAPVGVAAGIYLGLGVATTGGAGTLISSLNTGVDLAAINTTPTNFYVNIHNAAFPGGAVRGQLGVVVPEPPTLTLLLLGLLGLMRAGRRRP